MEQFSRNEIIIGKEGQEKIEKTKVLLVGVGGVGGFTLEALARAGVGKIDIIDADTISKSNINRQIIALHSTLGMKKVDVAYNRAKDINPNLIMNTYDFFYGENTMDKINYHEYDFIIDCIDTVPSKLLLIQKAKEFNKPIICSMGCGNKLDPTKFQITDISKTTVCPLARTIRQKLRQMGIKDVKVLFSTEEPQTLDKAFDKNTAKAIPGSISFVPSVAGLLLSSYVINKIIRN